MQWLILFKSNTKLTAQKDIHTLPYTDVIQLMLWCKDAAVGLYVNSFACTIYAELHDKLVT